LTSSIAGDAAWRCCHPGAIPAIIVTGVKGSSTKTNQPQNSKRKKMNNESLESHILDIACTATNSGDQLRVVLHESPDLNLTEVAAAALRNIGHELTELLEEIDSLNKKKKAIGHELTELLDSLYEKKEKRQKAADPVIGVVKENGELLKLSDINSFLHPSRVQEGPDGPCLWASLDEARTDMEEWRDGLAPGDRFCGVMVSVTGLVPRHEDDES
jgi:hypothetical protein